MSDDIEAIFGITKSNKISDGFIVSHPDPMWDIKDFDPMKYLPSYMAWCMENVNSDGNLICMGTINALAESGRSKSPKMADTSFKFSCTQEQRSLVVVFLRWCLDNLDHEDENQIERALRQWSGS